MTPFAIIAFDADDTLWHNERLYVRAQNRLKEILSRYMVDGQMDERLYQTEMRNLSHFGYGIKAFTLSLIETAIELTEGRVGARDIQQIIEGAREMMGADIELLDHASETLAMLSPNHRLMLITKGDLLDQETKIGRSGLAQHFQHIEIVSDKSAATYRAILRRHSVSPQDFLMVGNSLRSDILPVLEIGGNAVYIPQELSWLHENAETPAAQPGFFQIKDLGELPMMIRRIEETQ
ncbi:MAG TPA: HAD family hydrolase [Anaerolineales bacterium]|nr:HAD family hydrolase [Anaerolineales bacterium]